MSKPLISRIVELKKENNRTVKWIWTLFSSILPLRIQHKQGLWMQTLATNLMRKSSRFRFSCRSSVKTQTLPSEFVYIQDRMCSKFLKGFWAMAFLSFTMR